MRRSGKRREEKGEGRLEGERRPTVIGHAVVESYPGAKQLNNKKNKRRGQKGRRDEAKQGEDRRGKERKGRRDEAKQGEDRSGKERKEDNDEFTRLKRFFTLLIEALPTHFSFSIISAATKD